MRHAKGLLASTGRARAARLPDLIAVHMTQDELTLVLTGPSPAAPSPVAGE
jgi:hypothetical protein